MEVGVIIGIVIGSLALFLILAYLFYTYYWLPNRNRVKVMNTPRESAQNYRMKKLTSYPDTMQMPDDIPEDEQQSWENFNVDKYYQ